MLVFPLLLLNHSVDIDIPKIKIDCLRGGDHMHDYVFKGSDTALMFFWVDNLNIEDKHKEFLVWSKFFDSFHYDESATLNLIYINHPLESYIGFSLRTAPEFLETKMKRYAEGLAYLLLYYFRDINICILTQDECLTLVENLMNIQKIPFNMCVQDCQYLNGDRDCLQVLFARPVNPQLILDKFYEFYKNYRLQKASELETRIGIKPACDSRILQILSNAYLSYCIRFYNVVPAGQKGSAQEHIKDRDFIQPFFEYMGVPDIFLEKIEKAKNVSELFDDPELILVPPETVAEFALGYK